VNEIRRRSCIVCEKPIRKNEVIHRYGGTMGDHSFHYICHERLSEMDTDCSICKVKIQENILCAKKTSFFCGLGLFIGGAFAHKVVYGKFDPEPLDNVLNLIWIGAIAWGLPGERRERDRLVSFCLGSVLAIGMSVWAQYVEENVT